MPPRTPPLLKKLIFFCLAALAVVPLPLKAQTWTGTSNFTWSVGSNWSSGSAPTTGNTAILEDTSSNRTITYDSAASGSLGTLTINQTSAALNELFLQRNLSITNALILGFASFACAVAQPSSEIGPFGTDPALRGLRLVWADEFNGTALDTGLWGYRTDSKHWSQQKPGNVEVSGGTLKLHLKKEDAGDKRYTGAGVISKTAFRYGYYEARLKIPSSGGWHTSFWMMHHNRKGGTGPEATCQELDVIENDSIHQNSYEVNIHRWKDGHVSFGGKKVETPNLSADFHVFGCEFTPETVRYFFDGKLVRTFDVTKAVDKEGKEWPFPHGDQNIWLTSIASHLGGTQSVDDAALPAMAEFDYVRFFVSPNGNN